MPSSSSNEITDNVQASERMVKKNRPKATRLRQQKLPAWQPILTSTTVIPTIFLIGIIFIPIGIALLIASNSVSEWQTYYEHCNSSQCTIHFHIDQPFRGKVYFYYGLENFFQNHRRYMKSRNNRQLLGNLVEVDDCAPYDHVNTSSGNKKIAPCGAIANSMFNDTFRLLKNGTVVPWTYKNLAWEVDENNKFHNPKTKNGESLCDAFKNTVKPPNWKKNACELDKMDPDNNGFKNTDFMIWMRTAALPDFRKPYRRLVNQDEFSDGLPAGDYALEIENNYNVSSFSGKKSFIISTTSWAGGKNSFLGIAYITVGTICIILALIFLIIHIKFGHFLSEMMIPIR